MFLSGEQPLLQGVRGQLAVGPDGQIRQFVNNGGDLPLAGILGTIKTEHEDSVGIKNRCRWVRQQ